MGYSFAIGNGKHVTYTDYGEKYSLWEAEEVRLENAPVFENDSLTGNSNSRHPSYSGWTDFCRQAGEDVFDLFYVTPQGHHGPGTLIPDHPGGAKLEQKHLDIIKNARIRRENIGGKPGFNDDQDYTLARLMWLEFWIEWALNNCENPMFVNH